MHYVTILCDITHNLQCAASPRFLVRVRRFLMQYFPMLYVYRVHTDSI